MRSQCGTFLAGLVCCAIGLLSGCGDGGGPSDTTLPDFTDLTVSPDPAKAGDTLTVTFTVSEKLGNDPTVRVNGNDATFVSVEGIDDPMVPITYTYSYLVQGTEPEGYAQVDIWGADPAGNENTAAIPLSFDFTAPTLDVWVSPDPAKAGDTLTIEVHSADLSANPSVTVAGNVASFGTGHEFQLCRSWKGHGWIRAR